MHIYDLFLEILEYAIYYPHLPFLNLEDLTYATFYTKLCF